ncbi:MAG: PaaI family thioesterase [Actinobacteria bacterium]|nr:PaaI family thioesterase [Actinomycetota bacterium]
MSADLELLAAQLPFSADLGIRLEEASSEKVIAVLPWAARLCTTGGIMHGGALMTLADSAGALVAYLGLPEGASTATMTSTTQFFRPLSAGQARAVAVPLYRGRTSVTVQTTLRNSEDKLVAQTTQIQAIRAAG